MKNKIKLSKVFILIFLSVMAILFVVPYFWMISNSFKSTKEILLSPNHLIPLNPTLDGYTKVLTTSPFFTWLKNSLFITIVNTFIILATSSLLGYVFSKFKFKMRNILLLVILGTMMIPSQVTLIPSFLLIDKLGLYNKLGALIYPSFINAFGIYLCKQFCDEIPDSLIESARIDGAKDFKIFYKIILPILKPALGALTIFTFLNYWNDYLNPLIMLNDVKKMTLPLALSFFANQHAADLSATMAASALIMIPVTIVFMMFQKYFIKGITMTGIK